MDTPNDAVNTHCKKVNKFSYGDMPQGAQLYCEKAKDFRGVEMTATANVKVL